MGVVRTIWFNGQQLDAFIWEDTTLRLYRGVYTNESCGTLFTLWLQNPSDEHCVVATRIMGGLNFGIVSQLIALVGWKDDLFYESLDGRQQAVVLGIRAYLSKLLMHWRREGFHPELTGPSPVDMLG